MPKPRATNSKSAAHKSVPICQVKITLNNTEPPVWRRFFVREDINLGLLHAIIQIAMGWTNSHLHQFSIGGKRYSDPEFGLNEEAMSTDPTLDEAHLTLAEIVKRGRKSFEYEYDFGDSWRHTLVIEKAGLDGAGFQGFALCTAGERACPPEDCGAPPGFANLLKVIKNPKHPEYESMMEWLGGEFDPNRFDIDETNRFLHMIKKPNITGDQLAVILIERDEYEEE